jgi:FAD synthetase
MSSADEVPKRVLTYIKMVEKALEKAINTFSGGDREREIIRLAELYLNDSKFYFNKGDYITALSCIAYSEGLIDAMRILGVIDVEWSRPKIRRVLVGGTFDILHIGHIHYLQEASNYGLVYAVVARDSNVTRIKGKEPVFNEKERVEMLSSIKYVYRALLGDKKDFMKPVEDVKPDVIVLGPDQPIDENYLVEEALKRGLKVEVMRLAERIEPGIASTTNIIKRITRKYCTGNTD